MGYTYVVRYIWSHIQMDIERRKKKSNPSPKAYQQSHSTTMKMYWKLNQTEKEKMWRWWEAVSERETRR